MSQSQDLINISTVMERRESLCVAAALLLGRIKVI
jgi:hypothetical protein